MGEAGKYLGDEREAFYSRIKGKFHGLAKKDNQSSSECYQKKKVVRERWAA